MILSICLVKLVGQFDISSVRATHGLGYIYIYCTWKWACFGAILLGKTLPMIMNVILRTLLLLLQFIIWDTAGQERYKSLTTSYYRKKDVIVIVFDLTAPETFEGLIEWINEARKHNPDAYAIIVGNKSDHEDRRVSTKDGDSIASQYGMPYFETSAKNADVEKIFDHLAKALPQILLGTPISPTGTEPKQVYCEQRLRKFSQSENIVLTNSTSKCCK